MPFCLLLTHSSCKALQLSLIRTPRSQPMLTTLPCCAAALVGQLGTAQLSAVSVGSLAVALCPLLFSFLVVLTTPEVAEALGRGDADKVWRGKALSCGACWYTAWIRVLDYSCIQSRSWSVQCQSIPLTGTLVHGVSTTPVRCGWWVASSLQDKYGYTMLLVPLTLLN